ncbi:MAG: electron transport complex subunit RsxE [Pseudomonadales bacterium]|jgi:Na+-translocating ferredoxin:NAD+ oxidoreductase subunit E|uniref:electron transport complex subunit E n=1 Tax=unclassified Ketobacter TaxID=2639109 RepID=UPI000C94EE1B|nr:MULTISPECIES: electron transport complex subunit E [unclassified Ketobacter]MAQ27771.1 electron transport complex subunit RsxE [Pseudomonadales bacterium]MEC8810227.1 electron transport complex subunit E [Pseudomonadota bacterium]TNC88923.1 MAG: electron transport complex subunit RsxE [Alcanivorax sp.]HAU14570.1 electron transport complex subunit RsxE [Gammaproteobacteria bacterium]RLT90847.1 MAG: electron transport complex subunit E [Ketobacter sp. GenoA1]|tara:strand:- start:164 stop:850 length:687 start_codon:yes stop_codon:yes gene_type:complete
MTTSYSQIFRDGLWDNNVAMGQMLGLCPLLAVTTSATNGLGMGIASLAVLLLTNTLISLIRGIVTPQVRIPVFIVLIASAVTLVDMAINAWLHELYKVLGLFIALIVTNCAIFGRAESFASKNAVLPAMADALAMGIGFTWVLVAIGGMREILGSGTLFAHASLLLGESFTWLEMTIIPDFSGILLSILPPGAFMALGFLIAIKRLIDRWAKVRQERSAARDLIAIEP